VDDERKMASGADPERVTEQSSSEGSVMDKPVQWVTLQELRDELDRTRPAWETTDLDGFLADAQLPVLGEDAHRHQLVADKMLRRPSEG
jgi:hypothetical protein